MEVEQEIVRGKDMTEFEKGFIMALTLLEKKATEIQKLLEKAGYNRGLKTIRNWKKKFKLGEGIGSSRDQCKGLPKIHEETAKKILDTVKEKPETTASDLANDKIINHNELSKSTFERFLNNEGYFARKMTEKPILKGKNQIKRYQWALDRKYWTQEQWNRVVFTDESQVFPEKIGNHFIRRKANENPLDPKFIFEKDSNPSMKIMLWGAISSEGPLDLVWLHSSITSEVYVEEILKKRLSTYPTLSINGIFQQDNAPPHKAIKTLNWLKSSNIDVLIWPPQSPDLNLIENVWGNLKNEIYGEVTKFHTEEELWNLAQKHFFSEKMLKIIQNCYASIKARIQKVIDSNGYWIDY